MNKELKKILTKYLIVYGIIASFLILFAWNKTRLMIGGTDGICQHFVALRYISRLLRDMLLNIFRFKFSIPQYEFNLGMGDDILTTLNYYGLGDPLTWLLVPFSDAVFSYVFSVYFYFRLGIAGIITCVYMYEMISDREDWAYVIGGLLYSFSGFALESNTHIIFIHAMMYLPLLLWAVELKFKNRKHAETVLFWAVCGLALSGFYYLYIIGVTVSIYTVYRWLFKYRKAKSGFLQVIIIGIWFIAGIMCASITLVPEIIAFLSGSRNVSTTSNFALSMFYSFDEVKRKFYRLFFTIDAARGMACIAICGLVGIVLIVCSKKHKQAKSLLLVGLIAYFIPAVDYIMSGARDNIYNRWEIVLSLLFSMIFVLAWDELRNMSRIQVVGVIAVLVILATIGIVDRTITERCYRNSLIGYVGILLALLILRFKFVKKIKLSVFILPVICILCITLTWLVNVSMYPINSEAYGENDFSTKDIDDFDNKYRIDTIDGLLFRRLNINQGMLEGYSGTTEYFSMINSGYTTARNRNGLGNSYLVTGMDFRSILSRLSSVKYIIAREGDEKLIPYGYKQYKRIGNDLELYEAESVMPLAYYYDKFIDYELFNGLNPIEKQYCMTRYASLEDCNDLDYVVSNFFPDNIIETSGIDRISGDEIICKCRNGENYLVIGNQDVLISSVEVDGVPRKYFNPHVRYINIGNHKVGDVVNIKISTSEPLSTDMLSIQTIDTDILDSINELVKIDNSEIAKVNNGLLIETSNTLDACVCVAIPYTVGWKAYVDGREIKIYRCNDFYMGINVPGGTKLIELKYETPGLKIGFILTIVSITAFFIYIVWNRLKTLPQRRKISLSE